MTEVSAAIAAHNFLTNLPVARVRYRLYILRCQRQPITGPAGPGVILVLGTEQFRSATDTAVGPVVFMVDILACKCALRTFVLRNLVLLVSQPVPQIVSLFPGVIHRNFP